jgi:hypothetical protein
VGLEAAALRPLTSLPLLLVYNPPFIVSCISHHTVVVHVLDLSCFVVVVVVVVVAAVVGTAEVRDRLGTGGRV